MEIGSLLNTRYRMQDTLGERRHATTYLAVDERTGRRCVVKQLSVRHAYRQPLSDVGSVSGSDAAKLVELFEREGRILGHLDHPRVPKLIDHFTVETPDDVQLYLVQEYLEQPSLDQHVASGRHFTEPTVVRIALQITEILAYLHRRSPPIIHRDIKPSNILYGDTTGAYLIDFGAVKDRLAQDGLDGSTVVGTYDYMPPEQYQGNAVPSTDIYSLGVTLIAVLSHLEPAEITRRGGQLDFRRHVHVSKRFAGILEKMVEPTLERRHRSSTDLERDLRALLTGAPRSSRRRVATAAGVALLVAFAGSTGMYIHATRIPDDQAPTLTSGSVITAEAPLPANDPVTPVVARDGALQLDIFQDFKYVATGWPMGLSVSQTAAGGVDRRPYEDLGAEPHYVSDEPLYGYLPLGNGADSRITYVIDELERPTWIVYVDKNNNEDLTDDGPPYQNEGTGKLATAMSLTIVLSTASGKTITAPYHLWFWVNERSVAGPGLPKLTPRFYARCHYTGEVDLGGHIYRAVAFEYDRHNGLFAENGIWIDLDADGELQKAEHFQHGDAVRIGDDIFRIRLGYP